ncbi:MAG: dicarboxylate/amino acid:cation symporter [Rickettsiales bacterium]
MAAVSEHRKFLGMSLWQQVFAGMILGIGLGFLLKYTIQDPDALKDAAEDIKILGTIFLTLIKMVVAPLIFLALVSGITSLNDMDSFTRIGLKGIAAYLTTACFAVIIGLLAALIFQPGMGVPPELAQSIHESAASAPPATAPEMSVFLMNLIPSNIFKSFVDDHFLQIVFFAIFFGVTMNLMGERVAGAREVIRELAFVVFKMIENIVKLAPIAVFGFMAWMVATQGMDILKSLGWLIITVIVACIFQYGLFGLMIRAFTKLSPFPFYKKMLTTQTLAFATSSSKATLTTAMRELETKLGVSEKSTNFMMPLGACVNMDGTAIYLGICAVFFSQMFGIPLHLHEYLILLLTCTLGSIGAAGIPSGSIIFMGMVLTSVGLPIEGIGIILGVDRLLDMLRTTINITGDATITLIIDDSEDSLNRDMYYRPVADDEPLY